MSHTSGSSGGKQSASASSAPTAIKGNTFVIQHEMVGPSSLYWRKNQVVVPGQDFNVEGETDPSRILSEAQLDRLRRLDAVRDATADELKANQEARKAAEEAGVEFTGYFVPVEEPEVETVRAER